MLDGDADPPTLSYYTTEDAAGASPKGVLLLGPRTVACVSTKRTFGLEARAESQCRDRVSAA